MSNRYGILRSLRLIDLIDRKNTNPRADFLPRFAQKGRVIAARYERISRFSLTDFIQHVLFSFLFQVS